MARAQFPEKLQFLFQPKRYKVLYSGRDGVKSRSIAQALLIQGTQRSIRESVHQLLADTVKRLGLESFYRVLEYTIKAPNGTEFIFAGLRNLTVEQIKSFESIDIAWAADAQGVRRRSWQV